VFGLVALASAASWALGTVLWRKIGEEISPYSMNLGKGVIGCLYLALVFLVIGIEPISMQDFLILGASGILGITLGDTFFFKALMNLGPSLASLMGTLLPVSVAFSAVIFLSEKPSFLAWAGIFLTVGGVAWVLKQRIPGNEIIKNKPLGIKYRLLSILCMTAGVIFAKVGISSVSAVEASFIRMAWGVAGLIIWGIFNQELNNWIAPFKKPLLLKKVSFIVLIIVFGGFWLSLVALKYTDASFANTLGSTSPLFVLPLASIVLKEKISMKAGLGAALAVGGVALILAG
jgi:drug/metabolite transporter (DMT)-like permease